MGAQPLHQARQRRNNHNHNHKRSSSSSKDENKNGNVAKHNRKETKNNSTPANVGTVETQRQVVSLSSSASSWKTLLLLSLLAVGSILVLSQRRYLFLYVTSLKDSTTMTLDKLSFSKVSDNIATTLSSSSSKGDNVRSATTTTKTTASISAKDSEPDTRSSSSTTTVTPIGAYYQVLETLPHDRSAFTQGLVYVANGTMYEGTGLYGFSEVRRVDIRTGNVLQRHDLGQEYFGEGITYYPNKSQENNNNNNHNNDHSVVATSNGGRILQITWQEQTAFVYDAETFQILEQFTYTTTTNEGWGITYNPNQHEFIVSDGSEWLHVWDATTMQEKRKVRTTMTILAAPTTTMGQQDPQQQHQQQQQVPVRHLNELEWDPHGGDDGDGTILANVWYRDAIVRIDPKTGHVVRVYDFSNLHTDRQPGEDCFNGIALADKPDEIYVTGKKWPVMYRVKLLL